MNSVVLIGRLTRDPELRFAASSGKAVANFTLAVNRPFNKDQADFLRVVVFGKQAENSANYLSKGRLVAVRGSIQTGSYETNTGEKRYTTDIVADNVEFLEWGDRATGGNQKPNTNQNNGLDTFSDSNFGSEGFQTIEDDEDIPF